MSIAILSCEACVCCSSALTTKPLQLGPHATVTSLQVLLAAGCWGIALTPGQDGDLHTSPLAPRGGRPCPPLQGSQVEISTAVFIQAPGVRRRLSHCPCAGGFLPCSGAGSSPCRYSPETAEGLFTHTHTYTLCFWHHDAGWWSARHRIDLWSTVEGLDAGSGVVGAEVWSDASLSVCLAGEVRVPLWVKKGGMKFPADPDTPVIMIGPGTGVAPFRAAIQERVAQGWKGEGRSLEGLRVPLAAGRSVFSTGEGRTGGSGGFGQAPASLWLGGSKLGSGGAQHQSLVCAACVIIHRLCCQAAPWGRAGLCGGSLSSPCEWSWVAEFVFCFARSCASVLVPSSLPWLSCGSPQEAAKGLVEGNSTWGSPCPTRPAPPAFPAHGDLWLPQVTRSQAHTTPEFCGCQLPPAIAGCLFHPALMVCSLQGTACSLAAARNPRTSTARQSGKSW